MDSQWRNIVDTYATKDELWGLYLYSCSISWSATKAMFFIFPYKDMQFDEDDILQKLWQKNHRSVNTAYPATGTTGDLIITGIFAKDSHTLMLAGYLPASANAEMVQTGLPSGGVLNKLGAWT